MKFPRGLRLMLVIVMLLVGGGVAQAVHLSLDHSGHHHQEHDTDHCAQCFFLMHGQTQPSAPTLDAVHVDTVRHIDIVHHDRAPAPVVHISRHTRAPPAAA